MGAALGKVRQDAWGENLSEERKWAIYNLTKPPHEGEEEGRPVLRTYELALVYLRGEAGIEPPSRSGWYRFLSRMRHAEHLKMIYRVQASGLSAVDMATEAAIPDEVAAEAFKAKAVDALMSDDTTAAKLYTQAASAFATSARAVKEIELKEKGHQLKENQLKLAVEKFEAEQRKTAAASETISNTKLTPEQKESKLKEIYGI